MTDSSPAATGATPLPAAFYDRPVLQVASDLLACTFLVDGVGGVIVETEAYRHDDPACHGYRGKTARNAVLFGRPGLLYVYFTYGMHYCSNLVCGPEGQAAAVLLRALEPVAGLETMAARRGVATPRLLCSGPARLAQALGLGRADDGLNATQPGGRVVVLPRAGASALDPSSWSANEPPVVVTPRIGIRAGNGDELPWRFVVATSAFLSRPLRRAPRR